MMDNIVYLLKFDSGHYYIGSTKDAKKRKREHFSSLKRGKHANKWMQRVCNLYGEPNLSVICECDDRSTAFNVEQGLLDKHFDNEKCLNVKKHALIMDDEACAKITASKKGKKRPPFSDEHRARMSVSASTRKRLPRSPEVRAQISQTLKVKNAAKKMIASVTFIEIQE